MSIGEHILYRGDCMADYLQDFTTDIKDLDDDDLALMFHWLPRDAYKRVKPEDLKAVGEIIQRFDAHGKLYDRQRAKCGE